MKINRIDTFLIDAKSRNWLIAKITTDEGITGIGEESFEVTDFKSRIATTIAYKEVQRIEAKNLSRGAKIALWTGGGTGLFSGWLFLLPRLSTTIETAVSKSCTRRLCPLTGTCSPRLHFIAKARRASGDES